MLPVLFSIGPITIYSLGFFLGVGFLLGAFVVWRRLIDLGYKEEKVIDLVVLGVIFALVLGRLFYISQNFSKFAFLPGRWLLFGRYPGLSFWGGIMGLFLALRWFSQKQKWDFWSVADEAIFGLLPFMFLSQVGAFFDGCSAGKITSLPWGVFFPGSLLRQHPVSLFASLGFFIIWFFLLRLERRWRFFDWYRSKRQGFIFLSFCFLIFNLNLLLAFLRESFIYFYWAEIFLSFLGMVFSGGWLYQRSGRNLKEDLWPKEKG